MTAIIETKRIDGKPAHRLAGSPEGAWHVANSEIDAMLARVEGELGVTRTHVCEATGIHQASITRCRQGKQPLSDLWVLRLADFSGIPVSELRRVACVEPITIPHHKARRAS